MKKYLGTLAFAFFGMSSLLIPTKANAQYFVCDCCDGTNSQEISGNKYQQCPSLCAGHGGWVDNGCSRKYK